VIVLLETVHPVAHQLLETADDVVLVADVPTLGPEVERADVRALVTRGRGVVDAALLRRLPGLEVVARCGAGLDIIDTRAAAGAGIAVVRDDLTGLHVDRGGDEAAPSMTTCR
jgi:D-3-phosphoglycerate dehydrogenase / 2-oxoglutarate reductase